MKFRKILVPVGGTEADEEAIRLACELAKKDKSLICAVYVIPVQRTLPLDAEVEPEISKAEDVLNHIEDIAIERGCDIEADLLQSREVAPAIVDEATEREADLIILGVEYKTRFGEFNLGDVIPYVLKNAHCRVILYQQYTAG
jgi:nucleotide-binding universal stress UspA family protein